MLAIIIVAIIAFPPLLMVGLAVAEELEWQDFKRKTGIR